MSAPTTPSPSRAAKRKHTFAAALAAENATPIPTYSPSVTPAPAPADPAPAAESVPAAPATSRAAAFAAKFKKPTPAAVPDTPAGPAEAPSSAPARSLKKRRTRRAAAAPAAPAGPVVGRVAAAAANPRLRWLAYNAGAAGAGTLVVWSLTGDPMAGVGLMARATISVPQLAAAGLTVVSALGGWKAAGMVQLQKLPGWFGLLARPAIAVGAALWGQGTAPVVRDALTAIEPYGTLLSPLLAAGPVAAACWYGLDRRAARAQLIPAARWIARIPLATVVATSLIYAPGALL